MSLARSLVVVPFVLLLSACDLLGGPDRFVGVLAGASTTGVIELALPKGAAKLSGIRLGFALPAPASGEAVATIFLSTGTIDLTGTFDPTTGQLILNGTSSSGGAWSLTGTFASDAFSGSYTSPDDSGTFVAAHATGNTGAGTLKLYCGTYSGDSTGVWNLIVAEGGASFGVHCDGDDCGALQGTVTGNNMTLSDPSDSSTGTGATGTTDGTTASGTWTGGSGQGGTWEGTTASCEAIVEASEDPAPVEFPLPIALGLTNPFDLAIDATHVYTFDDGKVVRCPIGGCFNSSPELVAAATSFPSSLAIENGTLYVAHDFRRISSCSVASLPCTLAEFVDVGESTYPSHLTVHAGHLYWLKESGGDRSVSACPVSGCGSGPVAVVNAPALLSGVAVSGIAVGDDTLHVQAYFGALYAFTLTSATASSGTGSLVVETGGACGGLNRVGSTLYFAQPEAKKFRKCSLPACSDASDVAGYEAASTPAGITANDTHVFLLNRGNATGNTFDAGTGMIMRAKK